MRSLTVKLTLAFFLVGLTGATAVALLIGQRTRSEFDRFLSSRDQTVLVTALTNYYGAHQTWEGIETALDGQPPLNFYSRDLVLTDAAGQVVLARRNYDVGESVPTDTLSAGQVITMNATPIGYMLFIPPNFDPGRPSPEIEFLQRIAWAAAASAMIAGLVALLLGSLLAQNLARPIRQLTEATHAMAGGQLGQQVTVSTRDEVGELAAAFNQMSSDLARASQLRKQMTADLAHDLRTPLTILRGYTEGLQSGRVTGSPAIFATMHGEVEHLQHLVEDLRTLSLADAGELTLNRRAVDPRALLERTGLAYFMQAEQQGVTLRVEADSTLPAIMVDTDRLTQVLNNLVSNALRHTTQGEIVLSAATAEQHVQLTVSDTGAGIAPEDVPFIFDRFYSADKSRQRFADYTTGLGLAIAKAIVEAHAGTIDVASVLGQGTTFTLTFTSV